MKKVNVVVSILLIFLITLSACAPMHRVVRAKSIKESDGEVRYLYGVTYNNVLIPEYTKSATGLYATSYDGAWDLFDKRAAEVDSWIGDKYELTNSTWFRFSNSVSRLGLLLVSPFVVPVEWLGEKLAPDPDLGPPRSFGEIAHDFFDSQYDQPVLKNPDISEQY